MLIMYNHIRISEEHKGTKYVIQINYEIHKNRKNLRKNRFPIHVCRTCSKLKNLTLYDL